MFAKCTTSMGATYTGFVVAELTSAEVPKVYHDYFSNRQGQDRYFLVYDYEYDELFIKKLGYDIEF